MGSREAASYLEQDRAVTPEVVIVRSQFFWQRTSRVCFGEWPVSWHLICESVRVYVSSSLEGFSRKMKYMSSVLTQDNGILWKHCAEAALYGFSGMCKTQKGGFMTGLACTVLFCEFWHVCLFCRNLLYLFEVLLI